MAVRPYWNGYLKLSLVTCPVQMAPATSENDKVKFHTLNRATGNRVTSRYVDSATGKEVEEDAQVKGYERGENDYVMLEDEELESVALESTKTIDIEVFSPRDAIEWVWLDTPYYLSPSDPVGQEAFSVIRDAMTAEAKVGISRLVLSRRERAVMLEPRENGIVLWTLRYGDEIRNEASYFGDIKENAAEPEVMRLAAQFIKTKTRHWDASLVTDPVQDELLNIIKRKKHNAKSVRQNKTQPAPKPTSSNVIDIMDALRKSMAAEKRHKHGTTRRS